MSIKDITVKDLEKIQNSFIRCHKINRKHIPEYEILILNHEDMVKSYAKLNKHGIKLEDVNVNEIKEINGQLMANDIHEKHHILISEDYLKDTIDTKGYIQTIIHETIHMIDYYRFMIENNISKYEDLLNKDYILAFQLISEFRARTIALEQYRPCQRILEEKKMKRKISKYQIAEADCNGQYQQLMSRGLITDYDIFQLLGRFRVWQNEELDIFEGKSNLLNILKSSYDKNIEELYNKLLYFTNANMNLDISSDEFHYINNLDLSGRKMTLNLR